MKITIELNTDTAAFVDNYTELKRVLVKAAEQMAEKIDSKESNGSVRDYNGNKVLTFEIEE